MAVTSNPGPVVTPSTSAPSTPNVSSPAPTTSTPKVSK